MAKYVITSIPQSLPEAQKGGSFKLKKIKSNKLNNFIPKNEVTEPMVEVQGVEQPSYWNDMQSPIGTGEACPPGKYSYNGECLTEQEYMVASNKEMTDIDDKEKARQLKFQNTISDIYTKRNEEEQRNFNKHYVDYTETFDKSKKSDKIEPFERISLSDLNSEREKELQNDFLINKNSETGYAELYPKSIAYDRIIKNGFQADQFKNYWGLDPKQVESQMGDIMKAADEQYTGTVTQDIINKAITQGKTTDEIISGLSPKVGTKSGLKDKFGKSTNKFIDDTYAQIQKELSNNLPGADKTKVDKDRDVFLASDDPQDAWERKYHNGDTNLADFINYQADKVNKGKKAYSNYKDLHPSVEQNTEYNYANIDDQFADIRANNLMNQKQIDINEEIARGIGKNAESEDFQKAQGDYISNYSADALKGVLDKMLNDSGKNQKSKLKVLKALQDETGQGLQDLLKQKTGNKNQTYNDLLEENILLNYDNARHHEKNNTMKAWDGINENDSYMSRLHDIAHYPFHGIYYAMNPREEMWGDSRTSYINKKAQEKKYGVDLGTMPFNVMSAFDMTPLQAFNPVKVGDNLRRGYDEGNFMSALGDELIDMGTSYGLGKGFNALGKGIGFFKPMLNALNNPLMNAGLLAKAPENFSNAYDDVKAGNYGSAAWSGFLGVSGVAPAISALRNLSLYGQTPTKAFNLGVTTPSGKYYGFKQMETPSKDLTYAINNQVLAEDLGVGLNNQRGYKSMMKQFHPDVSLYPQKIATDAATNLGSLRTVPNTTTMVPGFNRTYPTNINTGEIGIVESPTFNLGRNYKLNVGSNIFKPQTLEEILLRPRPESYNFFPSTKNNSSFNTQTLFKKNGGALPKAQLGKIVNTLKGLGRYANIGTMGTANTLAKTLAPIKINPVHIPTFGMLAGERTMIGPFTGSPLNALPIGTKIKDNEAFRYLGDTLDYAKLSKTLNSADGPLLRMGKNKIVSDPGQWFEQGARNAAYSSVFGVRANADAPGSNLRYMPSTGRNGVLIGDMSTSNPRILDLKDPGLQIERRFPFSEKTFPINMDKFNNDEFDWKTQGGNLQSLIERYGYAALAAAGLAGVGTTAPQEYLDKYVNNPVKQGYQKVEDLLTNPWEQPKRKEGGLVKAQTGLGVARTARDIGRLLKPVSEFRSTLSGLGELGNLTSMAPIMNSVTKSLTNLNFETPLVPKLDYNPKDLLNYYRNRDTEGTQGMGLTESELAKHLGDFKFKDFSDGWLARQELSNLATFGKQPLLNKADFANQEEMFIEKLFQKYGDDPAKMTELAQAEGISPDAVLLRILTKLTNRSERNIFDRQNPFYVPENWNSSNKSALWNTNYGQYKPFGKDLNEYGSMGGKPPVSFGDSGEFDQYYWDQIKKNEEFLSGDYNMSPEQRSKIESKISGLYQKGINQGLQQKGFDLKNPLRYTGYDAMRTLTPNKYGGELPQAQLGLVNTLKPIVNFGNKFVKALTPSTALKSLPKARSLSEALSTLYGVPTPMSLPRISSTALKTLRQVQNVGRAKAVFKPLSQQYQYALNENIPDYDLMKMFGKTKTDLLNEIDVLKGKERADMYLRGSMSDRLIDQMNSTRSTTDMNGMIRHYITEPDLDGSDYGIDYGVGVDLDAGIDFVALNNYRDQVNLYNSSNPGFKEKVGDKTLKIKEGIVGGIDNILKPYMSDIPMYEGQVLENIPGLHIGPTGMKGVSDRVFEKMNKTINSGDVFTGSSNTSHSSYLPQLKQTFKYQEGEPQYLGYKSMNDLGFLSNYGYSKDEILNYLNTEMDVLINKGFIPKNIKRPYIMKRGNYDDIRLPHYGIKQFIDGGSMQLVLNPKEIDQYVKGGYIVEDY